MPNRNYLKGRKKEYKIIHHLKEKGFDIAHRTAGSHSPIDVFAIDKKTKTILFIQSKPDNFSDLNKKRLFDKLGWLKGVFKVQFQVI